MSDHAVNSNVYDPVYLPSVLANIASGADEARLEAKGVACVRFRGKVSRSPKTAAIVLAGGSGERFGQEGGKQLIEIAGRPTLTWSIAAFDAVDDIGEIVRKKQPFQ